jgi:hypothetical protein
MNTEKIILFVSEKGILRIGFASDFKDCREAYTKVEECYPSIDGIVAMNEEKQPIELEEWQIKAEQKYDLLYISLKKQMAFKVN